MDNYWINRNKFPSIHSYDTLVLKEDGTIIRYTYRPAGDEKDGAEFHIRASAILDDESFREILELCDWWSD